MAKHEKPQNFAYTACLFHKIVTDKQPPYLYNKITFRTDVHNLNLRHKRLLTMPQHKTVLFERSFVHSIGKIYNNLHNYLKSLYLHRLRKGYFDLLFKLQ